MKTAQAIRKHVQEELITGLEVKVSKHSNKTWREGIPGVILDSRLNLLQELLEWIDEE